MRCHRRGAVSFGRNDSACHRAAILPWTALRSTLINGDAAKGEPNESIKSCSILALQAEGRSVTTVEALSRDGKLHPLQEAFIECHGLQCGFCTPGMLMAAAGLLSRNPRPSEAEIVDALEGNLCRCTGYVNIVAAVQQAAQKMGGKA